LKPDLFIETVTDPLLNRLMISSIGPYCQVVLFAVVAAPMEQIHPSVAASLPPVAPGVHQMGRSLHVSSGYGLFRRMTGVGEHGQVARPEVRRRDTATEKLRIVRLGFGTARQKRVLERWTNPKPLQPIWNRAAI
jgi:hypothetical protein